MKYTMKYIITIICIFCFGFQILADDTTKANIITVNQGRDQNITTLVRNISPHKISISFLDTSVYQNTVLLSNLNMKIMEMIQEYDQVEFTGWEDVKTAQLGQTTCSVTNLELDPYLSENNYKEFDATSSPATVVVDLTKTVKKDEMQHIMAAINFSFTLASFCLGGIGAISAIKTAGSAFKTLEGWADSVLYTQSQFKLTMQNSGYQDPMTYITQIFGVLNNSRFLYLSGDVLYGTYANDSNIQENNKNNVKIALNASFILYVNEINYYDHKKTNFDDKDIADTVTVTTNTNTCSSAQVVGGFHVRRADTHGKQVNLDVYPSWNN